jgi:hypothetical protein
VRAALALGADGGESRVVACAGLTTTRRSTVWATSGAVQQILSSGLAASRPCSTAYPSALWKTARLRRWVVAAAGWPPRVRELASSAARTTAGFSSAVTGSDARAAQASGAATPGGGSPQAAGLNAQPNSAARSTAGSGATRRVAVRATVTVVSASATDRREVPTSCGHFIPV